MVTTELDLKKLNQDIATLRKNRENVPLELLKTKYKKPYAKLKEEIRAQFEIYMKHIIVLGILKTGPDLTGAKAKSMVDQIQEITMRKRQQGTRRKSRVQYLKNSIWQKQRTWPADITQTESSMKYTRHTG